MRIGQVASKTNLTVDTIRFYEKEGLIAQGERNLAGYRLYREKDVQRLRSIGRAQRLGFTLNEIRELLMIDDLETGSCAHVHEMIALKLEQVKGKLRSLRQMEENLLRAQAQCQATVSTSERCECPVLRQLHHEGGHGLTQAAEGDSRGRFFNSIL